MPLPLLGSVAAGHQTIRFLLNVSSASTTISSLLITWTTASQVSPLVLLLWGSKQIHLRSANSLLLKSVKKMFANFILSVLLLKATITITTSEPLSEGDSSADVSVSYSEENGGLYEVGRYRCFAIKHVLSGILKQN
jgi:hypothetical protein